MAQLNEQSLEIEMSHLVNTMAMIAAWIVEAPRDMIPVLEEVAKEVSTNVHLCARADVL